MSVLLFYGEIVMPKKTHTSRIDDRMRLELALDIAQICMIEFERKGESLAIKSLENAYSVFGCTDTIVLRKIQHFDGMNIKSYVSKVSEKFLHHDDIKVIKDLITNLSNGNIF